MPILFFAVNGIIRKYYETPNFFASESWFVISLTEMFIAFILTLLTTWNIISWVWLIGEFIFYLLISFWILWATCQKLPLKRQYQKR